MGFILEATVFLKPFVSQLSLSEAAVALQPLAWFVVGMALYCIFVFRLYHLAANRDLFTLKLDYHEKVSHPVLKRIVSSVSYILKYALFFPIFTFIWFAAFTLLLSLMSKSQPVENIILASIAIIATIRITAYYNEELSCDLAKTMPFALLAIFLVDSSALSFAQPFNLIARAPEMWEMMSYYFGFVIVMEFALRLLYSIASTVSQMRARSKELDSAFESLKAIIRDKN